MSANRPATGGKGKGSVDMSRGKQGFWFTLSITLCAAFLAGSSSAQQAKILLKNGKEKTVMIKEETYRGVEGTAGGASSLTPWPEIDSIRYVGGEDYHAAVESFQAGKLAEAQPRFEALLADDKIRPPIKQGTLYHLALLAERQGKPEDAIARYESLLEEFPKSRYLLPAGTNLLSIALAKGDLAGVSRSLEPSLATARDAGAKLQAGIGLLRGRILEEQKQFEEAEQVFESSATSPDADPDTIAAAKLGLARCAQKRGAGAEAEKRYRELCTLDASNVVLAGAWNGIGDLSFEQGSAKRDPDALRLSVLAYLRGVVLYVPGREDPSEEYERALAGSSKAFRAIGELDGNAERKKKSLERAKQCRDQLASSHPSSRYLKGL